MFAQDSVRTENVDKPMSQRHTQAVFPAQPHFVNELIIKLQYTVFNEEKLRVRNALNQIKPLYTFTSDAIKWIAIFVA